MGNGLFDDLFDDLMRQEPNWDELVPEFKLRPQQHDALRQLHHAMFVDGAKATVFEAPTGVGKSIVALALCRFVLRCGGSSFIVTPQKTLQDQLGELPGVKLMKGRASYKCASIERFTAANAPCTISAAYRESHPECSDESCPYFQALCEAKKSPIVAHNYASLIAQTYIGGHFSQRHLLCLDEGHSAADWIRNYMTLELEYGDLATITTLQPPTDERRFMGWFRAVMSQIEEVPSNAPERVVVLIMRVLAHRNVYGVPDGQKINDEWREDMSARDPEDRVPFIKYATDRLSIDEVALVPWHVAIDVDSDEPSWKCTPVKVAPMASILTGMGAKIVMISATVLDDQLLLKEIGLQYVKSASVMLTTAFDPKRRPIVKRYVGSMARSSQNATMPRLLKAIAEIMDEHPNESGIIHTVSYALAGAISVPLSLHAMTRSRNVVSMKGAPREETIRKFLLGGFGPNAVLIGPALMEGIDGIDDSARWQAMVKVPWPYRGDPVVSYFLDDPSPRMRQFGERWYTWKTVQQTVQGIGRVCRSNDDFGVTYLLDSGFEKILNCEFIPKHVTDAVTRSR